MHRYSGAGTGGFGWRLGFLAAAVGIAVYDVLCHAQRRREDRLDVAEQVSNWENEGGAAPPSAAEAANEPQR